MMSGVRLIACSILALTGGAVAQDRFQFEQDVNQLALRIDALIDARIEEAGVEPAQMADDAEYLRRAWLDIAGKIPSAGDVHTFLEDDSRDKRQRVVGDLLDGPGYVVHFSRTWRHILIPEANSTSDFTVRFLVPGFERWLRDRIVENAPFDELARELLTAPVGDFPRNNGEASPVAFFYAKQIKPENLAAATSRVFLGLRTECAQCHDHPFDEWKQEQFWGFAAFYAAMQRQPNRSGVLARIVEFVNRESKLTIPGTTTEVAPVYLDGQAPVGDYANPRKSLANWVTSKENRWFARTASNRIWAHLFGIGLVNPVDDFSSANPPSHPKLLTLLADELAKHDFDFKYLITAITRTQTYQRSSHRPDDGRSGSDDSLFAYMSVKGLTADQLYDSITQATGRTNPGVQNRMFAADGMQFRQTFEQSDTPPTERQTSVLQALMSMNGIAIQRATDPKDSRTLRGIADYPLFNAEQRIEAVFVATLSRKPTAAEMTRFLTYLKSKPEGKQREALSDIFWALLNSSEFVTNH